MAPSLVKKFSLHYRFNEKKIIPQRTSNNLKWQTQSEEYMLLFYQISSPYIDDSLNIVITIIYVFASLIHITLVHIFMYLENAQKYTE